MFIAVFVRRLREGKTYEDFLDAWYPDKGFGFGGRGPITARSLTDEHELLTIGFVDLPDRKSVDEAMARLAEQESLRHDRIDEFDFSTDESVERGRP